MSQGFSHSKPAGVEVIVHEVEDDGLIPNSRLPLLIYRNALRPTGPDWARSFEKLFATHDWIDSWRDGIYDYHHYHSTAHEVLGIYRGFAVVQFGGDQGVTEDLREGDVVIIPAGVGHKRLSGASDLGVVGAYPSGQEPDLCYAKAEERPKALENLRRVSLPKADPVFGFGGALARYWFSVPRIFGEKGKSGRS
jgi:uncharacterized protein YjlB